VPEFVKLRLSSGETRYLDRLKFEPGQALTAFADREEPFDSEFVGTTDQTEVNRVHIVEAYVVELPDTKAPRELDDATAVWANLG